MNVGVWGFLCKVLMKEVGVGNWEQEVLANTAHGLEKKYTVNAFTWRDILRKIIIRVCRPFGDLTLSPCTCSCEI